MSTICNIPDELVRLLRGLSGFSLGQEQLVMASEAVQMRMVLCQLSSHEDYIRLLEHDLHEQRLLVELLTVNETYFMREPDHLQLLVELLAPQLRNRQQNVPVRIFCAGCSTGEEAYSVAMLLSGHFGKDAANLFSIMAVDIDSAALARASAGIYGGLSFRGGGQGEFLQYFEKLDNGRYQVVPDIRQMVSFSRCNLLEHLLPVVKGQVDVILYRNVSIYFSKENQIRIFNNLADLLRDGGILLVGATETLHHNLGILNLAEHNQLFYYRKPATSSITDRRTTPRNRPQQEVSVKAASEQNVKKQPVSAQNIPVQQNPGLLFDRALLLARNRSVEQALELLEDAVRQDPYFVNALLLKAFLLLDLSLYNQAVETCQIIDSIDPLRCESYLISGMVARQNGKENDAFDNFRKAIFLNQSCWVAQFYSAEILYNRKEYKLATAGYQKTVTLLKGGGFQNLDVFFPLSFDSGQFMTICQHKLSLLKETR